MPKGSTGLSSSLMFFMGGWGAYVQRSPSKGLLVVMTMGVGREVVVTSSDVNRRYDVALREFGRLDPSVIASIRRRFGIGRQGDSMRSLSREFRVSMNTVRLILGRPVR